MKLLKIRLAVIALCTASGLAPITANAVETAVTPNAHVRTQALLNWLSGIQGTNIVSGQMEGSGTEGIETPFNRILNLTGKYPGVRGFDFAGFSHDRYTGEDISARAVNWYNNKGIVEVQWHWYMKGSNGAVEVYATQPPGPPIALTDFDISKAVTAGTSENTRFMADIDTIAAQLKKFKDASGQPIPVLWRPFHECSSRSFWWGTKGSAPLKQAWKIMFDRLVTYHGLKNLIWVFNPSSSTDLPAWYPGDEYVDIISADAYAEKGQHPTFLNEYVAMRSFAGINKLVTMTENGGIPDTTQLASQGANWVNFMTWHDEFSNSPDWNSDALITSTYGSNYVLTRDELPSWSGLTAPTVGAATKVVFTRQPSNAYLGDSWVNPVYVGVTDANGRIVRSNNGTATVWYGSTSTNVYLVNGVGRFNPTFNTIAANQTLSVVMRGLTGTTSGTFSVGTSTDKAQFNFESSLNGWKGSNAVSLSGLHAYAGTKSLQLPLTSAVGGETAASFELASATGITAPKAGQRVRFRVWIPEGTNVNGMYAFVQENGNTNWRFTSGLWFDRAQLVPGTWNTVSVTLPTDAAPLYSMGIKFIPEANKALTGTAFIDSVSW